MRDGVWRYNPLPSQAEVDDWYKNSKIFDDEPDHHLWYPFFDENLRWLNSHKIVDIGPGAMAFVNYANMHSKKAIGVDLHIETPKHIHLYSYDEFEKLNESFEAGRMRLVLEHVLDPVEFLAYWRKWVSRLLIIVPNEFNPLQMELIEQYGYNPVGLPHLSYFEPYSLEAVCVQAGWKVTRRSATFPMELFAARLGFNYVNNPKMGTECHKLRLRLEKSFGALAFDLYRYWFSTYGWGRELVYLVE